MRQSRRKHEGPKAPIFMRFSRWGRRGRAAVPFQSTICAAGSSVLKSDTSGDERLKNRPELPMQRGKKGRAEMEIGAIPGLRGIPTAGPRQSDLGPPAVSDIDAAARPGEGGGQRNGRKAAGAEENDEDELKVRPEDELGAETAEDRGSGLVNYFA